MNVPWADAPIAVIAPGSSAGPAFNVQVIRPRHGLPLGGILPPGLFGVDERLGFNSASADSAFKLSTTSLEFSGDDWELRILSDGEGQINPKSEVVFDLIFEEETRRVRCTPADSPIGRLAIREDAPNEHSGEFVIELANCEDALTGESLGWPPKPLILRGSFDRIPMVGK